MAPEPTRTRNRQPARRSRAEATPSRPSRLRLWLRRRRGLMRPAGLALGIGGLLTVAALATMAADPYGRIAALWDGAAEIAGNAGLTVQEVTLEGSRNTPPELVREALGIRRGDPILAFDPQAAKERLELIAWVNSAHVERHLNGSIRIRITERQPFAIWQRDGRFSVIDEKGEVVSNENIGAFGRLPLIVGTGANRLAAPMVALLRGVPEVQDRTHALVRVAERRWNLRLRNGVDVLLPDGQEAAALTRLAELQQKQGLLDRPLAAIDLRLPDKLVLRLPGQATPGATPPEPSVQRVRSGRG
ncbi:cell division protein FtsQ/DivIB [Belnapia rosea]|uniref:Cell division protein FtsQ n=1 Tax=Belnapia rosea TaxID=938405 RepID=A0A1G6P160_9PROT|nr:cell division protein FtsQ/DivIB [Belnapia rosea]SDB52468.1 cell division protein FtsQ [Belnapia rosea]SDC73155.1 cell division protein FtsQ [Belnapia rosea]